MAILSVRICVANVLVAAACYSPQPRDCTVSCETDDDCVNSQICSPAGMCAAPQSADECVAFGAAADARIGDARVVTSDGALVPDAAPPSDAASVVVIAVTVTGKNGTVTIAPGESCTAPAMSMSMTCTFPVVRDLPVTLRAVAGPGNIVFDGWTGACSGSASTCVVTPLQPTTVLGATFAMPMPPPPM